VGSLGNYCYRLNILLNCKGFFIRRFAALLLGLLFLFVQLVADFLDRFLHVSDRPFSAGTQGRELLLDRIRVMRDLGRELVKLPTEYVTKPSDDPECEYHHYHNCSEPGEAVSF